mmetsp:Transcript_17112/g.33513  ORF Transcript_17112/g.33513 Transcript_17112/m.33513 type:complete len:428 (-) Transcript_17112:64-1347(-)
MPHHNAHVEVLSAHASSERAQNLLRDACEVLHAEWPAGGSVDRRIQRLCDAQDTCCFLGLIVQAQDQREHCVGFAQLQAVTDKGEGPACAITSVVTSPSVRGSGLGRLLMSELEVEARKRDYGYVYLWTSTAQGFYAKCGYECCESVNLSRPILGRLADTQVSALERMLQKMGSDMSRKKNSAGASTQEKIDHEDTDGENVVWMRKRLKEEIPVQFLDTQDVDKLTRADLVHLAPQGTAVDFCLVDVPLYRQIGPSCGLAALRMARHFLCGEPVAPGAPSLLQEAIRRGFSHDGELYDIEDLALLARDVSGLNAKVVKASVEGLKSISPTQLVIIPYDRGGGSAPAFLGGKAAHYGLVVGNATFKNIRDDTSVSRVLSLEKDASCDACIVQHGMSRRLVTALTQDWLASNADLTAHNGLCGKMLLLS